MRRRESLFALDLGTTKFTLGGIKFKSAHSVSQFETISVPAAGMKRGMLADFEAAKEALTDVIGQAEEYFDCDIHKLVLGIGGNLSQSSKRFADIEINPSQAINEHTLRAVDDALEELLRDSPERQVLHRVATGYRIDGREFIANPMGFSGSRLSAEYLILDADQTYLKDLIRLVNQCGIKVSSIYSTVFCGAMACVDQSAREMGCVYIDIGGGSTDGLVFVGGQPMESFWIGLGGGSVTQDIAIGLNLPLTEAERIKLHFGLTGQVRESQIQAQDLGGGNRIVSSREIQHIAGSRTLEIAQNIAKSLSPYKGKLGAGLRLTGGGSELAGIAAFLSERFRIPVRPITASFQRVNDELLKGGVLTKRHITPSLSSLVGLLVYELMRQDEEESTHKALWSKSYFGQIVNWFKELS